MSPTIALVNINGSQLRSDAPFPYSALWEPFTAVARARILKLTTASTLQPFVHATPQARLASQPVL
ncbi:MAG: hypothetical protein L7U83_07145 [Akkermansiaceae bacterium]|nr:hypothetical protein [Akkermansiaceae bacterium]